MIDQVLQHVVAEAMGNWHLEGAVTISAGDGVRDGPASHRATELHRYQRHGLTHQIENIGMLSSYKHPS